MFKVIEERFKTPLGDYSHYFLYDGAKKVVEFQVPSPENDSGTLTSMFLKYQTLVKDILNYIGDKLSGNETQKMFSKTRDVFDIDVYTVNNTAYLITKKDGYQLAVVSTNKGDKAYKFAQNLVSLLNGEEEIYKWIECY